MKQNHIDVTNADCEYGKFSSKQFVFDIIMWLFQRFKMFDWISWYGQAFENIFKEITTEKSWLFCVVSLRVDPILYSNEIRVPAFIS